DMNRGIGEGFPDLGLVTQPLESSAHWRALGLPDDLHSGILILDVVCGGSVWGTLRRGDVLLKIGGASIAPDGSVEADGQGRFHWQHEVTKLHVNDRIAVRVWRDQAEHEFNVKLKPPSPLVPEAFYVEGRAIPRYYLFGGLLFIQLTSSYIATWQETSPPPEFLVAQEAGLRTPARTEVVVLQEVLADECNRGYHDFDNLVVDRVQGKKIRNLREVIRLVEESRSPFVRFESAYGTIVIDRAQALERHDTILERFGVPVDRSLDLRSTS
ncbi:MAG: serine protease, partial [Planctomycetota bacterium]|nr:serine protease [Planctomycetota bacterium]